MGMRMCACACIVPLGRDGIDEPEPHAVSQTYAHVQLLDAARAALSATISELVDALPKLEMCGAHGFSRQRAAGNGTHARQQILARVRGVAWGRGRDARRDDMVCTSTHGWKPQWFAHIVKHGRAS